MPDNRLIDANALPVYWGSILWDEGITQGRFVFMEDVDNAPTIDAVPVMHGRWEKVQVWKDNPQTTLRCSLCKTNQPIYEHEEWKFCPFCGQPMDAKDMDVPTKDGGAR